MTMRTTLSAVLASTLLLAAATAQAADVFPAKAYTKPDEPITVQFVNEKGDEGKKAVVELGAAAAKLDALFTPAAYKDIIGADSIPTFKLFTWAGEEIKLAALKPAARPDNGRFDLDEIYPKIKEGGTYFLVWKDAPPLVIETIFNPGRGAKELEKVKARIDLLSPDERKTALASYSPAATHMELAEYAVITTDKGVIKAKFAYDAAPHTVDNFVSLARQGFYDASAFHRIISGFMIQGGDGYANVEGLAGMGGPGYQVMHVFSDKKHVRGVLSMARSQEIDSAGSQFFIMHGANANLDGQYSAFGDVIEGLEVVDTIARTPSETGSGAVKGAKPKIVSIKILPATAEIYGLKK
jgi:peptidyl-prolyl cis-trans isomerase B (cyclophilin B)